MAFNELEAAKLVDEGKLSDNAIKMLVNTRDGVAFEEVEGKKEFEELQERGLVMVISLSHPRATVQVPAVIPTEPGVTILNMFDKRFRENANASRDANTAQDVDPKLVKAPTKEEARKVPTLNTEPLTDKELPKPANQSKETKDAMKDDLVKVGAKDVSQADTDDKTIAKNATVKVEKK